MTKAATDFLFDVENDLRGAKDLCYAVFVVLERSPAGEQDVATALRCLEHLQDHVAAMYAAWSAAVAAEQEQVLLRPAA